MKVRANRLGLDPPITDDLDFADDDTLRLRGRRNSCAGQHEGRRANGGNPEKKPSPPNQPFPKLHTFVCPSLPLPPGSGVERLSADQRNFSLSESWRRHQLAGPPPRQTQLIARGFNVSAWALEVARMFHNPPKKLRGLTISDKPPPHNGKIVQCGEDHQHQHHSQANSEPDFLAPFA